MFAFLDQDMQIISFYNTTSDFIWELKQFPSKSLPGNIRKKPPYLPCVPQCLPFLSLLTYSELFIFVNLGSTGLRCDHQFDCYSGKAARFRPQPQKKKKRSMLHNSQTIQ